MPNKNNNLSIPYLEHLIGRVYKILPLMEQNNNRVPKLYVERLLQDLVSANDLFGNLLIDLIIKINSLNQDLTHDQVRSILFSSISLINKLKEVEGNAT